MKLYGYWRSLATCRVRIDARRAQLHEPHVAPLTAFVDTLRIERGPEASIPYFDPWDGGARAEVLYLLEAPGSKATRSGFISRNNPDETAKNFFNLNRAAGIPRERTVTWNIVPWYIGSGSRIRAADRADINAGASSLHRLLALLPRLQAVVLIGRKAERAAALIAQLRPGLRVYKSPHPSPLFVNKAAGNWERILSVLYEVKRHLDSRKSSPAGELLMTKSSNSRGGRRGSSGRGAFIYEDYLRNHVVWPGRDAALREFVAQTYGGLQHKLKNAHSSNSEDALTWSCFDTLRQVNVRHRQIALAEIWELAFGGDTVPTGVLTGDIHIGKSYGHPPEQTEVDLSIEGPGVLIFFEAKLYSSMSAADPPSKPHNQIARKLRVGAHEATRQGVEFYFILLDLAPIDALSNLNPKATLADAEKARASGFGSKWITSYWFARYKFGRNGSLAPLQQVLSQAPAVEGISAEQIARNMGWLTWADVFKTVLRAALADRTA